MKDNSFDNIIRGKLKDFKASAEESDWEQFITAGLDTDFDTTLRSKIENYNSGEIPQDWNLLDDALSSGFDEVIGTKLANVSFRGNSDWDQFEKILDNEKSFDEEIVQKLDEYQVPSNESQWPKLAEHLKKVENRRRRIIITKFIEAAIFILFFLSIMQLYPIENVIKKEVYRTHAGVDYIQKIDEKIALREHDSPKSVALRKSNSSAQLPKIDLTLFKKAERKIALVSSKVKEPKVQYAALVPKKRLVLEPGKTRNFSVFLDTNRKIRANEEVQSQMDLSEINASFAQNTIFSNSSNSIEAIHTLLPKVINASSELLDTPVINLADINKNRNIWFNIYGSPNATVIQTPYDKSYGNGRSIDNEEGAIDPYSQISPGYSLGASFSKQMQDFEIEAGIEYTSLNYHPKPISETTGSAILGYETKLLKEIILEIIEIPLNLKYKIFKRKSWNVYGVNGISTGIVAFADYDIDSETSPALAALEIARGPAKSLSNESFLERKPFNEGFVKSNNLQDNMFFTLNSGIGVEKNISDNVSFFVQPTYYYNISQGGLGPNNDVHHRLALQLGTKVRI